MESLKERIVIKLDIRDNTIWMQRLLMVSLLFLFTLKPFAQVHLQTGSATFSLPIFNWHDNKSRLTSTVSLSYNSGNGLKVNDVASNIGQGWNMIAGGMITRTQVGEADDQKPREGVFNDVKKYPPGYLYNIRNAADGCPATMSKYPLFSSENVLYKQHNVASADRELDYFSFQFNGHSGTFVLGKNNGDKGVLLGDSKINIWFERDETMINQGIRTNQHIRTTLKSFTIIDESGIQYVFSDMELNEVIKYNKVKQYSSTGEPLSLSSTTLTYKTSYPSLSTSSCNGYPGMYFLKGVQTGDYICSKWMLTRIVNPLTAKTIEFSYSTAEIVTEGSHSVVKSSVNGYCSENIVVNLISTKVKKLSSINNQYGDKVEFVYNDVRQDLAGDKVLNEINFYKNIVRISNYTFNYSYFFKNSVMNFSSAFTSAQLPYIRLCLSRIQKTGLDGLTEPPNKFDYYT